MAALVRRPPRLIGRMVASHGFHYHVSTMPETLPAPSPALAGGRR